MFSYRSNKGSLFLFESLLCAKYLAKGFHFFSFNPPTALRWIVIMLQMTKSRIVRIYFPPRSQPLDTVCPKVGKSPIGFMS